MISVVRTVGLRAVTDREDRLGLPLLLQLL